MQAAKACTKKLEDNDVRNFLQNRNSLNTDAILLVGICSAILIPVQHSCKTICHFFYHSENARNDKKKHIPAVT